MLPVEGEFHRASQGRRLVREGVVVEVGSVTHRGAEDRSGDVCRGQLVHGSVRKLWLTGLRAHRVETSLELRPGVRGVARVSLHEMLPREVEEKLRVLRIERPDLDAGVPLGMRSAWPGERRLDHALPAERPREFGVVLVLGKRVDRKGVGRNAESTEQDADQGIQDYATELHLIPPSSGRPFSGFARAGYLGSGGGARPGR